MTRTGSLLWTALLICASHAITGCAKVDHDRFRRLARYYEKKPTTIIVLPVKNESLDAEASWLFLATISRPLIDRGYYVYPTEVTAEILAREGITDAVDAWRIPPDKLHQYLGADAALYVTLEEWEKTYAIAETEVRVTLSLQLVDCHGRGVLWAGRAQRLVKSDGSDWGIIGRLIDAATTAAFTDQLEIASEANSGALASLPIGDHHPKYSELQDEIDRWKEEHGSGE